MTYIYWSTVNWFLSEASNLNVIIMRLSWLLRCLIECRDEYKYNVEAVELLIRNHLVNMQQYDLHLAQVCSTLLHYLSVIENCSRLHIRFVKCLV